MKKCPATSMGTNFIRYSVVSPLPLALILENFFSVPRCLLFEILQESSKIIDWGML